MLRRESDVLIQVEGAAREKSSPLLPVQRHQAGVDALHGVPGGQAQHQGRLGPELLRDDPGRQTPAIPRTTKWNTRSTNGLVDLGLNGSSRESRRLGVLAEATIDVVLGARIVGRGEDLLRAPGLDDDSRCALSCKEECALL